MSTQLKSKYYLKDILPKNYIDIHNHLLPDIDDGTRTVKETNYLIAQMKSININAAIATPHILNGLWDNNHETIKKAYKIATEIDSNKSFLKGYASEYMLDSSLLKKSNRKTLLVLPNNYLLVEISLISYPSNLFEILFDLKTKNYKIILAHPERYLYLHNSIKYKELKECGIYFQLNLISLTGYYGKKVQNKAIELLENDFYDFTGSDIHSESEINQYKEVPLIVPDKKKIIKLLEKNNSFIYNT